MNMKRQDRVKIVDGPLKDAVGEVVTFDDDAGTADVYISGIVHGVEVQCTETFPIDGLQLA